MSLISDKQPAWYISMYLQDIFQEQTQMPLPKNTYKISIDIVFVILD